MQTVRRSEGDRPNGAALGELARGARACHFFRSVAELAEVVVPFLLAGLARGERVLWLTARPLSPSAARAALRRALPDLDRHEAAGRVELVEARAHATSASLTGHVRAWLGEGEPAPTGARIARTAPFSMLRDGASLKEHETALHAALAGSGAATLCSYPVEGCDSADLLDALAHHGSALLLRDERLCVIRSAAELFEHLEGEAGRGAARAPPFPEGARGSAGHDVRFYDESGFPAGAVAQYLAAALGGGGAAFAAVARAHIPLLRESLRAAGYDAELEPERIVVLEGEAVIEAMEEDGALRRDRFEALVGTRVRALTERFSGLHAFGELVDLLCKNGRPEDALRLERWWERLLAQRRFRLLCGYALTSFAAKRSVEDFDRVCAAHHHVEAPLPVPEIDRGRLGALLAQRTVALLDELTRGRRLALDRAELLDAHRVALEDAEEARRHLARLQGVTSALSEAVGFDDIREVVRTSVAEALGAAHATLSLSGEAGAHAADRVAGEPDRVDGARGLPLELGGQSLGALHLEPTSQDGLTTADRALQKDIARQVALALDRARVYELAEDARARAEIANRAKDEFLAMLGHELRNPIAPMRTALELMRLRLGEGALRERQVIERQVRHMTRLVDDLLDVARITRGTLTLERSRVEIAEVVARAIETASPLLEQRNHRLTTDVLDHGLPVDGDPHRLAQAVANLLTNAAKYTPEGGRIHVAASARDGQIRLAVEDDGVGIVGGLLPHVFELFIQGEQPLARSAGGLGLGLAIVRRIVELHGGSVSAASDGQGLGSTFTLVLPCAATTGAAATRADPTPGVAARRSRRMPLQVLVVDDNQDAAEMLAEAIRLAGHEVRVAHDGPAALLAAMEHLPDLALLDIGLPVLDGYELARELRARCGARAPVLVAVTGYGLAADRERSSRAGFSEHLVKPIALEQVETVLRRLELERASRD